MESWGSGCSSIPVRLTKFLSSTNQGVQGHSARLHLLVTPGLVAASLNTRETLLGPRCWYSPCFCVFVDRCNCSVKLVFIIPKVIKSLLTSNFAKNTSCSLWFLISLIIFFFVLIRALHLNLLSYACSYIMIRKYQWQLLYCIKTPIIAPVYIE